MKVNEAEILKEFDNDVERYMRKYEEEFDQVAQTPAFQSHEGFAGREFTRYDAYQLGKQLEAYSMYEMFCRENASASELGQLPNIAMDLISTSYAISVAPLLSSIQTLGEEKGIIYFKQVKAVDSRIDRTAGDVFANATEGIKNGLNKYGAEYVENEVAGKTASGTTTYNLTLDNIPIRSNHEVVITIAKTSGTIIGRVIDGEILSNGSMTGTLSYTTGDLKLVLAEDPGEAKDILVSYYQDFEKSDDIPEIMMELTSTDIAAVVLALKMKISTMKAFQFNNRFGKVAEDDALQDLAGAMADIESREVIRKLSALADITGNTLTFSKDVPEGISEYEHRQAFRYVLGAADSNINYNAGRGYANRYVAGHIACQYLASLPKFVRTTENIAVGPHVFGYLEGVPVIRTKYIPTNDIICSYLNPISPFEAPVVTGTYMPIFITSTMQVGENPLQNQRAIASWKGFKGVVSQFVQRISLTSNS